MMKIETPETLNSLEVILIEDWMKDRYPARPYSVRSGNGCIWVTLGSIDMYFIFKDGRIHHIQVD